MILLGLVRRASDQRTPRPRRQVAAGLASGGRRNSRSDERFLRALFECAASFFFFLRVCCWLAGMTKPARGLKRELRERDLVMRRLVRESESQRRRQSHCCVTELSACFSIHPCLYVLCRARRSRKKPGLWLGFCCLRSSSALISWSCGVAAARRTVLRIPFTPLSVKEPGPGGCDTSSSLSFCQRMQSQRAGKAARQVLKRCTNFGFCVKR